MWRWRMLLHEIFSRRMAAIHTRGHFPGHCCFYEPARGYLFSGDLIYRGCLDAVYPATDPALFCRPVKKVQALQIGRMLPGHYRLEFPDAVIDETEAAFASLDARGKLKQGGGIFGFGAVQIHL